MSTHFLPRTPANNGRVNAGSFYMKCGECLRFEHEAEQLGRKYARAVGIMTASAITQDAEEYSRVRAVAERARQHYEVARARLEEHQRIHDAQLRAAD